jgi:6-phosphogluconate dehydrogenase (decarboxylating)
LHKGGNGFNLDLGGIFRNWSNGSVIRGWLVELMEKGLMERNFDDIQRYIEDTGEVNWLIQDALNKEIPIPVISQSVMELQIYSINETRIWRPSFWKGPIHCKGKRDM